MGDMDPDSEEAKAVTEKFIEAESFTEKGGWVVDQQSMEVLHSSYLMAHGMGVPVEDARTEFDLPKDGLYRVWCLTRDWTAVWDGTDSAGKFKAAIDQTELETVLGTNGKNWGWQLAGVVPLKKGTHTISLKDLTGFNARCDAIYLTDGDKAPGNSLARLDALRKRLNYKEIQDTGEQYDFIVVGGGVAGICTALSAIRLGVKTLLIHDRGVLGGCNSSEIRVCMGGQINTPPYPALGNVVKEIAPVMGHPCIFDGAYYEDDRKRFAFEAGGGDWHLMLNEAVTEAEMENGRLRAVVTTNVLTGKKTRLRGTMFSDCSGDGVLARLGGAEVMYGREAAEEFGETLGGAVHRNLVMGHSIRWYSREQEEPSPFPDLNWGLKFDEDSFLDCFSGDWEQETGFARDMVLESEYIRDYGLRAIYANWGYQKNHCLQKEKFAKSKLIWASPLGGKRESCRVKGDYILTQRDLEEGIFAEDGTAAITWGIDLHFPEPANEEAFGEAFRSFAYHRDMPSPCPVPYRCLYSKDIPNLFLGGRLVSASHVAFSAIRVMRTLGMLGEVAGMAASLCKKYDCTPREIYQKHLPELKQCMRQGVPIPTAFACGGLGSGEAYHFKDIGWWYLHTETSTENNGQEWEASPEAIAKFRHGVEALGLAQKYPLPEKWKI